MQTRKTSLKCRTLGPALVRGKQHKFPAIPSHLPRSLMTLRCVQVAERVVVSDKVSHSDRDSCFNGSFILKIFNGENDLLLSLLSLVISS